MRAVLSSLLLSAVMMGVGCGGGDSAAIKEHAKIVEEMCACKDADCAKKVDSKESSWRMKNYKGLSKQDKGKMKNARQKLVECRDKLTK